MKKNKKKLMIASTPQDGRTPTRPFYNPPYRKPDLFIKDKQTIQEAKDRFKGLTGIDLAMDFKDAMGGGGFIGTSRTNVFVNQGGEAYILEPSGNFKFDGMYTPEIHGPVFPRAKAPKKDNLKIANLSDGRPDASIMNYVTEKGYFLDGQGKAYQQRGGQFGGGTEYNPDIHGLPVPLVKNRKKLKIGTA